MQVTAVGKASVHCNVGNWGDSPDLDVNVICYNHNGDRVDARFDVLFLLPSDHLAYAYADQPTTPSYTPDPFYSSNPGGGTITITRLATGRYSISWPGFNSQHFRLLR